MADRCNMASSAVGTTGANSATLSAGAGKMGYLCGFSVSARATAAAAVTLTVTGIVGGTLNFDMDVPAAPAVAKRDVTFDIPLAASAPGVDIVLTLGAPGAGGVSAIAAWGIKE